MVILNMFVIIYGGYVVDVMKDGMEELLEHTLFYENLILKNVRIVCSSILKCLKIEHGDEVHFNDLSKMHLHIDLGYILLSFQDLFL